MPIHFLWGDEDYLIEKEALKIKNKILNGDINPLNYRVVDNPKPSEFSELLRTNSMMFGASVIQIKCDKYFLEIKNKIHTDDKQILDLINAFNNVSDSVHIILICPTPKGEKKKPDSRKKIYKELIKITQPISFVSFRNYEEDKVIPYVKEIAKDIDVKINNDTALLLIRSVGTFLRDISIQMEKLKLYCYPEKLITNEAVVKTVSVNYEIDNLIEMILKKDWTNALSLISKILQKEHFLPSMAFLQSSLSNLLKIKLYSKTMSQYDLAVKLNLPPFIVKLNTQKVASIDLDELVRLKMNLTEAEYCLKSGKINDVLLAYEKVFIESRV